MTTPDTYLSQVDPSHIWTVCARAAPPGHRPDHMFVVCGDQYGARAYLPTRSAARAAHAALTRVGYQAVPVTDARRGLDLTIYGWSARGLKSRLTALRAVLRKLTAEPGSTAATTLDQLARLPATALPDQAGRQQLARQAEEQLRGWISATSGIHAPCDPHARPADPSCAQRLTATWQAEKAIDDLAGRHLQVTRHALMLYPGLRQTRSHAIARDAAIRQAGITFDLSRELAPDTSTLQRNGTRAPGPAGTVPAAAAGARFRPRPWAAREFPPIGVPAAPDPGPPATPEASPRGRTPADRPDRHRRVR